MSPRRVIILGLFVEVALLGFYWAGDSPDEVLFFIAVNAAVFVAGWYLFHSVSVGDTGGTDRRFLWLVIGFGLVFRLTLVPHSPVASDDMYRYLWDGRVASHGINPFALSPEDARLDHLHTPDLPSRVSFPEMRTIYPPLAQLVFLVSSLAFGPSLGWLKFILVLFDLCTMGLLVLLLRSFAVRDVYVVLYAWSPLPILYFGLDGHVDAVGIPFLLLALLLIVRRHVAAGAFSLGGAILAKLHPLFLVPLMIRLGKGPARVLLPAIPLVLLVLGGLFYLEPTGGLFESLFVFSSTWEFNGSLFSLFRGLLATSQLAHLASAVLFMLLILWLILLDRPFVEKTFLAFLGFFLLAPVVHPWYLTWLAALVVVRWSTAAFVFLGFSNLSNIVVYRYRATGIWQDDPLLLVVEYAPLFVLLAIEVYRGEFTREESLRRFPLTSRQNVPVRI